MEVIGTFPFGQPVRNVIQIDTTPKKAFILGVYASAVHARWMNAKGKEMIKALAIASEPYIFWRGENSESIINEIKIPIELGNLLPAESKFNGPSGIALDELFINPLKMDRSDVWLCDLVPHSCVNLKQQEAIDREYEPFRKEFSLTTPSVPKLPRQLTNEIRREEIYNELKKSQAGILVLLGDLPIKWFLSFFAPQWKKLADFGRDKYSYGVLHDVKIKGDVFRVLPLCHPRQSAKLGKSSSDWYKLHEIWCHKTSKKLLNI
jgi:hypothetical protein